MHQVGALGSGDRVHQATLEIITRGGEELFGKQEDLSKQGGYEVHGGGIVATYRKANYFRSGSLKPTDQAEPAKWLWSNYM